MDEKTYPGRDYEPKPAREMTLLERLEKLTARHEELVRQHFNLLSRAERLENQMDRVIPGASQEPLPERIREAI